MSARRVMALTLNLPQRSRTMREAVPDIWPVEETLLGLAIERLDALAAITVKANGGKAKTPPPIVPRPKKQALRRSKRAVATTSVLSDLDKMLGVA